MHAWPELYFAGYGWVRFEPTPAVGRPARRPSWTVAPATTRARTDRRAVRRAQRRARLRRPPTPSEAAPTHPPTDRPTPRTGPAHRPGRPWPALGGLVVLLILAAPATLRIRRRSAALRSPTGRPRNGSRAPGPRSGTRWSTTADAGPRARRERSAHESASSWSDAEADAMSRVATLVERSRYARIEPDDDRELPSCPTIRAAWPPQSRWRRFPPFGCPRSFSVAQSRAIVGAVPLVGR